MADYRCPNCAGFPGHEKDCPGVKDAKEWMESPEYKGHDNSQYSIITKKIVETYEQMVYPCGCYKHIFKDGARYHVLMWGLRMSMVLPYRTEGTRKCSELKCEINNPDHINHYSINKAIFPLGQYSHKP